MKKLQHLLGVAALMLTLTVPSFAGVVIGDKANAGVIYGDKANAGVIVLGVADEASFFESLWAMVAGIVIIS